MPLQRRSNAIVLKRKSLPTQDSMIFLFTREYGKVIAIARGIKKITSRRAPHVETGNYIHALLSSRGEYHYVQETTLLSGFSGLKQNAAQQEAMYIYLFALDRLLPAEQAEPHLFDQTIQFFQLLHNNPDHTRSIIQNQLIQTLDHLGYLPQQKQAERYERIFEEVTGEKLPAYSI